MNHFLRAVLSRDITVCAILPCEETQHHGQTDCRRPENSMDLPTGANKQLPRPLKQLQMALFVFVRTFNARNCSDSVSQKHDGLRASRMVSHLWYLSTRFCRPVRASTIWTNHNVVTFRTISRHTLKQATVTVCHIRQPITH